MRSLVASLLVTASRLSKGLMMSSRTWRGACGLAVALIALLVTPSIATPASAQVPRPPVVVTGMNGTALVAVTLDDNTERLTFAVREQSQIQRNQAGHDPASVVLEVDDTSVSKVPDDPRFAFLGTPGERLWTLTQAGGVMPHWDTTGVPASRTATGGVSVRLESVDGPGRFSAYTLSETGEPTLLLAGEPDGPASMNLPAGSVLASAIWAFDAPGAYQLSLAAETTLASGASATGETTYRVQVPEAPGVPVQVAGDQSGGGVAPSAEPTEPTEPAAPAVLSEHIAAALQPVTPNAARTDPFGGVAAAQAGTGVEVAAAGHVDIGPRIIDGEWRLQVRDDRNPPQVWRELEDMIFQVVDQAKIQVPPSAAFSFLGASGEEVWILPQTEQPGVLWPGWNTQDISVTSAVPGGVAWSIDSVEGPGTFSLFFIDSFGGPQVLFEGSNGFPQKTDIPWNTHAHGNWAFSEAGTYCLGITMSATTAAGEQVSDSKILEYQVGASAFGSEKTCGDAPGGGGGAGGGDDGGSAPDSASIGVPVATPLPGGANPAASSAAGSGGTGSSGTAGALAATGNNAGEIVLFGFALLLAGAMFVLYVHRDEAGA